MMQGCMHCVALNFRNTKYYINSQLFVAGHKSMTQQNARIGSESILSKTMSEM